MKKVFANSADLCHVWAQQRQPEGRANSIFFEGAIIYSYGRHYKMAKIHKDKAGNPLVLINSRGYSNSTAKHTNHARHAVSHLKTLDAPNVDPQSATDHAENVKHFLDLIADGQKRASRALKNGASYIQQAQKAGADHNFYIKYFKLKARAVN